MKKKSKRLKWKEPIDYDWVNKKIGGHGGSYYFYEHTNRVYINSIYGKNRFQILYYNIILLFKYLKRVYEKRKKL